MTRLQTTFFAPLPISMIVNLCWLSGLTAQQTPLTVIVDHIAGANLYIDAGTSSGIAVNDTLSVSDDGTDDPLGYFVVVTASESRSMVTFAGSVFPVTRGQRLRIVPVRPAAPVELDEPVILRQPAPGPRYGVRNPTLTGQIAFEMDGLQSRTEPINTDTLAVLRTFLTPAIRVRMNASQLPGNFNIRTNFRLSSQYTPESPAPTQRSTRIYQASVNRASDGLYMELGRFFSPFELYSGYWDGALLRFGGRNLGVGAALGFEPNRGNEIFSTEHAKATAFVDYRYSKGAVRYETDASVHQTLPTDSTSRHTFLGWSQSFSVGRIRFQQLAQADQDPSSNTWKVTRVQLRLTTTIVPGVSLRTRYNFRRPFLFFDDANPFGSETDDLNVGLFVAGHVGSVGIDATADRVNKGEIGWSYSSVFNLHRTWMPGLRFGGVVRYWSRRGLSGYYVSPGMSYTTEGLRWAIDYRLYVTDLINGTITTHGGTIAATVPLMGRSYASMRIGLQHGNSISNVNLGGTFSLGF